MNDKLSLRITPEDFRIITKKANDRWKITDKIERSTGLIEETGYCNVPDLFQGNLDRRGILVHFNPNRAMNIPIGEPISWSQINKSIEMVNDGLADTGIDCHLSECGQVKRYDNCFDINLDNKYNEYSKILQFSGGNELKRSFQKNYGDTLYIGNDKTKICIYDKKEQSKLKAYKGSPVNDNIMRMEVRHIIKGTKNRISLANMNEQKYIDYRCKDKKQLQNLLFSRRPEVKESEARKRILQVYEALRSGCPINKIQKDYFSLYFITDLNDLGIDKLVADKDATIQVKRKIRRFNYSLRQILLLDTEKYFELYFEMENKFALVA